MNHSQHKAHRLPSKRPAAPEKVLALGFLLAILAGTLLLMLPACATDGRGIGLMNAVFTATSAVCVTGLTIMDIGLGFSMLGQAIILLLIQIGGLGFMIFATLGMMALGRRISLRSRVLIRDSMNQSSLAGLVRLTQWTTLLVVGIETLGACLLMIRFIPTYGMGKGIWFGFFHSISAFCNAGFDLLGNFTGIIPFQSDPLVMITLLVLTICGGLGFVVFVELINKPFQQNRLTLHTRLVLLSTVILLLGGAAAFALLEWNNPGTLGALTPGNKLLGALFQSASCRSTGFCGVDQMQLTDCSKLISCVLMFIGASPASTGGGVKTTTFAMVILMMAAVTKGREDYVLFKKRISREQIARAVTLVFIELSVIILITMVFCAIEREQGHAMIDLLYKATAAVTTAGLSSIGCSNLSLPSQLILLPLMYLGRVGPLTLGFALADRMNTAVKNRINYPEENILIG